MFFPFQNFPHQNDCFSVPSWYERALYINVKLVSSFIIRFILIEMPKSSVTPTRTTHTQRYSWLWNLNTRFSSPEKNEAGLVSQRPVKLLDAHPANSGRCDIFLLSYLPPCPTMLLTHPWCFKLPLCKYSYESQYQFPTISSCDRSIFCRYLANYCKDCRQGWFAVASTQETVLTEPVWR